MNEQMHRITDAAPPRSTSIRSRQRKYLLAMMLRTVCFLAMVFVPDPTWLRVMFAFGAIVLPYVAVIGANDASNLGGTFPRAEGVTVTRAELQAIRSTETSV